MMMNHKLIYIVLLCCSIYSYAQDATVDFLRLNEAYYENTVLSMKVVHALYPSHSTMVPFEKYEGFYKRDGVNMHSMLMDMETMQNEKYRVMLDATSRLMLIADPMDNLSVPSLEQISTFMKLPTDIQFEDSERSKIYKIEFKNNLVETSSIEIYISKSTYLLDKIVMYYREPIKLRENDPDWPEEAPRVEVVFSEVDLSTEFAPAEFSESRYFTTDNGELLCTPLYNKYQLVNQKLNP